MSVRFSRSATWTRCSGQPTRLQPSLPVSISIWFHIAGDVTTGSQTLWWYGEEGTDNDLTLRLRNTHARRCRTMRLGRRE